MTNIETTLARPFVILLASLALLLGCPPAEQESPAEEAPPPETETAQPAETGEGVDEAESTEAEHEAVPARRSEGSEAPEDVAAPPADAESTASGLASKVLQEGTGDTNPGPTSLVTVHYTGWTTDGEMFDSSVTRGEPATFPLDRVIPGWTEGLQLMVVGEKRRLWIPEALAYGGRPGAPAGMLVFDVELLAIR